MLDHTGRLIPHTHEQTAEQIKTFVESLGATVTNTVTGNDTTTIYVVIKHKDTQ